MLLHRLKQPSEFWEKVTRGIGYLLIGLGAVWLLINPPSAMLTALGFWLTLLWCGFIITSIPAGLAVFRGDYATEFALLPFFTGALTIAVMFGWSRFATAPESGLRLFIVSGLVLLLVARWFKIKSLIQRPARGGVRRWRWIGIKSPR